MVIIYLNKKIHNYFRNMLNILSFGNLVYAMTTLSFTMKASESVL